MLSDRDRHFGGVLAMEHAHSREIQACEDIAVDNKKGLAQSFTDESQSSDGPESLLLIDILDV